MNEANLRSLFGTTSKTTLVKAGGIVVGVLINISIARLLGADGLGIINLSNQIVGILSMFALLGLPSVILKEVSIGRSNKNWVHVENIIFTSLKIALPIALGIIILGYFFIPYLVEYFFEDALKIPLLIIFIGLVFQVFSKVISSGLNGFNKIWQSTLMGNTLSIFFVGISLLIQYLIDLPITVISIALSYAIARAVVSFIIGTYWGKVYQKSKQTVKKFIPKTLLKVALPLLFVQATNTIANSIDSILIGSFLGSKEVGLYSVAFKIAFVSSFFLQVVASVLAPKVASLYANGKKEVLEKLVQKTTAVLVVIAVIGLLAVVLIGEYVLQIWGSEFTSVYMPLLILSIGQFVNIAAGVVFLILTHCDEEKILGYIMLGSSIINTILNIIFIQIWGILGASIATAFSMSITNFAGIIVVRKRVGITTFPFKLVKSWYQKE